MAEAFPSAILESVLNQLQSPIFQRNNLNCCLGIQLRDLRSKLEQIRSIIYDAELMGILFPEFVRKWVCDLQCILHELDDLLDEALTRSMPGSDMVEKVSLHLHNMPFNLTLTRKMKNINKRLEGILKECYKCNLLVERASAQPSNTGGGSEKPIPRTGILRYDPECAKDDQPEMIGRDDDKKKIIKMLFGEDPYKKVIIDIDGEAGVGKTTLARAAYDDEEVRKHFEVRLWFGLEAVKENFPIDLWKKMITALDKSQQHLDTEGEDQLIEKIVSLIGTRKILLVFDCYLFVSYYQRPFTYEVTNQLEKLYRDTYGGITTLRIWSSGYVRFKNDLSQEQSWSIFKNTALVPDRAREEWIEDLGKQIVSRCPGNPALLKGVGTLLHGKESENDKATWEYFAREFDFEGQYRRYATISKAHKLFQIFHQAVGYLSLFLEKRFKYEVLLRQFAANRFTDFSYNMRCILEETFLQQIEESDDWDSVDFKYISSSKDVIMQLAGADSSSIGWEEIDLSNAARHVCIDRPSSSTDQQQKNIVITNSLIKDAVHKRSLLFLGQWHPIKMSVQVLDMLASNLRYLRVLDLQDLALKELPSSIGKLILLRYLDLSRNDFKMLPRSVCRLKNLQTLMLVYCDKLITLPRRIEILRHLNHLEISMCLDLNHMPSTIGKLTCLQRLDRFIVCSRKGGLRYLEHLNNLNGHLTIELPRRWENSVKDAEKANLEKKEGLTIVEFKWQGTNNGEDDNDNNDVLEKLKPCTNIKNLFIINFGGTIFPSWIAQMNCLTHITISHCNGCKTLPPFHGFPRLRFLTLTSMMNIRYLQDDNSSGDVSCDVPSAATRFFPSLAELKIGCMPRLIGWSRDSGGLPRIRDVNLVEIWKCPCLLVMPSFRMHGGHVVLEDVSEKMLRSYDSENNQRLEIISIQDMVSLPDAFIAKLPMRLEVKYCEKWQMFWANEVAGTQTWESLSRGFQCLEYLSIHNCREMKNLSCGLRHLIELRWLKISRCSEKLDCLHEEDKDGMPWKALQKLSRLKIKGFEDLEAIPKGLQHLPSLSLLAIVDCKSLRWGLDRLPKVELIRIKYCPTFLEELEREGLDFSVHGKTVAMKWPQPLKPSTQIEEASVQHPEVELEPLDLN